MEIWLVAGVAAAALVLYGYNRLVKLRNRIDAAWADLDVQLTRRRQLIPDLVNVVSGYAAHERAVFDAVAAARAGAESVHGAKSQADAEAGVDASLEQLFAVAEGYPDLKADERFRDLQTELVNTENKVAFSRQLFNDTVTQYHNTIQAFPTVLLARPAGFEPRELFETEQREAPGVSLHDGG